MVHIQVTTDGKSSTTGKYMHEMVDRYYMDMVGWASASLLEMYEYLKSLPYRPDPPGNETLMRPAYTMSMQGSGGDCDDKAIAMASWAKLQGIPYRFVAVRAPGRKTLHHVYPELYINGKWVICDPTYNFNTIGRNRIEYEEYLII